MKDVSGVALVTLNGTLSAQGLHLCRLYTEALKGRNFLMRKYLINAVEQHYKQPSFLAHFREIDNDPTLYESAR